MVYELPKSFECLKYQYSRKLIIVVNELMTISFIVVLDVESCSYNYYKMIATPFSLDNHGENEEDTIISFLVNLKPPIVYAPIIITKL